MIDVLGPEKRRRRTTQEKIAIVQQSFEPGMTVSLVARQHGVAASQLFLWRKQYQEGSLTAVAAGEQVVPASELAAAMKQIKELQRLLGKKTMENEPRQPGGCKLKTAPVRPVVAARPAEYVCSEDLFY